MEFKTEWILQKNLFYFFYYYMDSFAPTLIKKNNKKYEIYSKINHWRIPDLNIEHNLNIEWVNFLSPLMKSPATILSWVRNKFRIVYGYGQPKTKSVITRKDIWRPGAYKMAAVTNLRVLEFMVFYVGMCILCVTYNKSF